LLLQSLDKFKKTLVNAGNVEIYTCYTHAVATQHDKILQCLLSYE